MGASGSSTSGVFQRSVPTANGSFSQGEKRGTTTPPKPTVSKAVKDSVHKSIAASGSLLGAGANGVCNGGVIGASGNAISYQRSQWSRNSLLARAKLASAVGRAQMHCRRCDHRWTDDGVEVFFDLGRLGMPKVVRKQCLNCGHLVVPSFSCLEWDRLANEALGKWSKKALEAHSKQIQTGAPIPIPEHCSVPVPDPITKGMVVINVDVVNNNSPR